MATIDAAPPNTRAGGNDDALLASRAHGKETAYATGPEVIPVSDDLPLWKRIHRHSLTQMMLLAVQSFCGPAMSDAITGLGGGGLATPQTANIATALQYVGMAAVTLMAGPIVNKFGNKWCLVFGAISFPIQGSSYYVNSKYGTQWYLILGGAITGAGTGFWYCAEAGSILSISPTGARGKYLALWIVARNLGQLVGGAINLAKNVDRSGAGGVSPETYLAFVAIECLALPFAFMITPLQHVRRSDGSRILVSERTSTRAAFRRIKKTVSSRLMLLLAIWAIWSFFYSGSWSTYLALYFSVRARALSSLISPFFCIVGCFGLGFVLDIKGLTQRRRAQLGFWTVIITNAGVYIWSIIMQNRFNHNDPGKIDWTWSLYPSAFLPYFFVQTTGPIAQSFGFWLLSSFAEDAQDNFRNGAMLRCLEAVGQSIAYGINTGAKANPLVGFSVCFGLMAATIIPTNILVNSVPERIPADVTVEEQDREAAEAYAAKMGDKDLSPLDPAEQGRV